MGRFLGFLVQALTGSVLLLTLQAHLASVHADEVSDCIKGKAEAKIRGCSRIINSGRLFGEPISKKKLAIAYSNRGVAVSSQGQSDRAIWDFTEAIRLNPKYIRAYFNRGTAYIKKGRYDEAIIDYSTAIKLDPKMVFAYHNRGNTYRKKKQYENAIADYTRAIKLDPKLVFAYHNRGLAYEKMGQREKAIADYRKTNELLPRENLGNTGLKRVGVHPR